MSESSNGGSGSGSEARRSASSLADAVVAALAHVSRPPSGSPAARSETASGVAGPSAQQGPPSVDSSDGVTTDETARGEPSRPIPAPEETKNDLVAPGAGSRGGASVGAGPQPASPEASDPAAPPEASSEGPRTRIEHLTPESASSAPGAITVQYFGRTDVGLVREHNEDNFLVADLTTQRRGNDGAIVKTTVGERGIVLAVCDGMGGAAAGEVASQMAVDTIHEIMRAGPPPRDRDAFARRLVRAIEEAGARIFAAAKMDRTRRGMGTTATVAGLIDATLFVGQVGDSRAYVLRGDQFALITKDQSLVNQLIEAGQLTEEEAEAFEHSNIILQALGTTEEVTVDLTFLELRRGDKLLLCSDGLSGLVHADMMKEVLQSARDLGEMTERLVGMANGGGGHDNITVIVAEFDGQGLREASGDARVAYQQYPLPPEPPDAAEVAGKSAASIKSAGPKPGADVKATNGAPEPDGIEPAPASRLWLVAVVLLLALLAVAAAIVLTDPGGRGENDDRDTTRVTIASAARSTPEPVVEAMPTGRIVVRTDVDGAHLFVNGQPHRGPVVADTSLTLPPGAYRLELREGDVRVAEATVTLQAGEEEIVELRAPAGASPEARGAADRRGDEDVRPEPARSHEARDAPGASGAAREGRESAAAPGTPP